MKKKVVRLTESDLVRIVKKVISEQESNKINVSDISNDWIGKKYPSSLSGNFLTVETDRGKVLVDGVVRGLRGIVEGTLTTNSFEELYNKYGYMIFTLGERMGMYSIKGLGLPYSIFTSNDKKTNRIIFPVAGSFVFNGGLSELEKKINENKSKIKKIKLSTDVSWAENGSKHLFMPIDDYGDGYIIPTKKGDPPRYLEEGEYEIIK